MQGSNFPNARLLKHFVEDEPLVKKLTQTDDSRDFTAISSRCCVDSAITYRNDAWKTLWNIDLTEEELLVDGKPVIITSCDRWRDIFICSRGIHIPADRLGEFPKILMSNINQYVKGKTKCFHKENTTDAYKETRKE